MWIGFVSGIAEVKNATEAITARSGTKLDKCISTEPANSAIGIGVNYDIITSAIQSNALIDWTWDANIFPIVQAFYTIFNASIKIDAACKLTTYLYLLRAKRIKNWNAYYGFLTHHFWAFF